MLSVTKLHDDKTWGIAIGTCNSFRCTFLKLLVTKQNLQGYKANAIGADATANGNHAMLLVPLQQLLVIMHKHSVLVLKQQAYVLTYSVLSCATADYSIAIGNKANASTANSIALGANSTTRSATNVTNATVAGHTFGGFAGTA